MGSYKEEEMARQDRVQVAIQLCESVGAIDECENHEGTYIDTGEWTDPDELTSAILKDDPTSMEHFSGRADMQAAIEEALQHAGEECPTCKKNFAD